VSGFSKNCRYKKYDDITSWQPDHLYFGVLLKIHTSGIVLPLGTSNLTEEKIKREEGCRTRRLKEQRNKG
jgi:hypothetical protein